RVLIVTGVQTCALPILSRAAMAETLILNRAEIRALVSPHEALEPMRDAFRLYSTQRTVPALRVPSPLPAPAPSDAGAMILMPGEIGRASCRERVRRRDG